MAEFLRPDVYVQEVSTGEKPLQASSTSTGALIGVTVRGEVGVPTLVTSWTDFVNKFARGCETPFLKNSDLPNAVYGFFQNGGSRCYIVRVASSSATKAVATLSNDLEIKAKDCGAWANDKLAVKVVTGVGATFNVQVYVGSELVETIENVDNDENSSNYFVDVINESSNFIGVSPSTEQTLIATPSKVVFSGGDDAFGSLSDTDFVGEKGLYALDLVKDVNLIAIPGKSSETVALALIGYADNRNDCFAIIDPPKGCDVNGIKTFREKIGGTNGAIYYPCGKVVDPIGRKSNSLKVCPPSGHIMGLYARIDTNRGVYKAPAGEECTVVGFADLESVIPFGVVDVLNPIGVNCIISKPNSGIIVWGARSLSTDPSKRYVSDVRYDIMVRTTVYSGTQWAVFEPNNSELWERLNTSLTSFLDTQWRSGALRGATAEEAYYVKCDSELNDDSTIESGMVVAEIGYAKQKPAEFVVVKIVQKTNS